MTQDRPDIFVIMTDQHRADVCAREGFPLDTTPFLDGLARHGTWFNRAYTTSPLCCPARTSLLTGRFPSAHRVVQNPAMRQPVFDADLFSVAKQAGYTTAMVGKNHTYLQPEDVDCFVEFMHEGQIGGERSAQEAEFDHWLRQLQHRTSHEPTRFPEQVQNPHRIVDAALDWVRTVPRDQPLLLLLSLPEPHNPFQVPEPYFSLFPPESLPPTLADESVLADLPFSWNYLRALGEWGEQDYRETIPRARANYFGMMRLIDDELGRFHDGVADRHAGHERVIVVTADHGDYVGEYGMVRKGAELPELLARIPMLVNGDRVTARAAPSDAFVSIADVFPTVCELIGADLPLGVQGRSLVPMLRGEDYPRDEFASGYVEQGMGGLPYRGADVPQPLPGSQTGPDGLPRFDELNAVTQSGRRRAVRRADWKLVVELGGLPRLYDLATDPLELRDRWPEPGLDTVKVRLLTDLATWQLRAEDPLPHLTNPRAYPLKTDPRNWVAPHARDQLRDVGRDERFSGAGGTLELHQEPKA